MTKWLNPLRAYSILRFHLQWFSGPTAGITLVWLVGVPIIGSFVPAARYHLSPLSVTMLFILGFILGWWIGRRLARIQDPFWIEHVALVGVAIPAVAIVLWWELVFHWRVMWWAGIVTVLWILAINYCADVHRTNRRMTRAGGADATVER